MSAVNSPFGFRPVYHPSGLVRAKKFTIASGYAANIFKGDSVKLVTAGTIQLATSDGSRTGTVDGIESLGIFAGCEYIDATGKPTVSNYWPTGQVATNITAWVWDDPEIVFAVQADGAVASSAVGDQADWTGFTAPGGSTATGISSATLSSSLVTAGQQGNWRIVDVDKALTNAWGDAYTVVHVKHAEHVFVAPITAI